MASTRDKDDEGPTCDICMDEYNTRQRRPVLLGCFHTLCLSCAQVDLKFSHRWPSSGLYYLFLVKVSWLKKINLHRWKLFPWNWCYKTETVIQWERNFHWRRCCTARAPSCAPRAAGRRCAQTVPPPCRETRPLNFGPRDIDPWNNSSRSASFRAQPFDEESFISS